MPSGLTVHSFYMCAPQVLSDMTQTMTGTLASGVTNRVSQDQPDGQGYTMALVDSDPPPSPIQPCSFPSARDTALLAALRARK